MNAISNLPTSLLIFILSSAEEDIYEDAEEDEFEYYEVGAGDAPYILSAGITFRINQQKKIIQFLILKKILIDYFFLLETVGENHNGNGVETEEAMDVEAGQFEDAEEDP